MRSILIMMLAIGVTFTSVFGQQNTEDMSATPRIAKLNEDESRQASVTIPRPTKLRNLRTFVKQYFVNRIDIDSILETMADSKPAITFSFTYGDQTTDYILIDNGDSLELNSDNYPTAWKHEVSEPFLEEPQAEVDVDFKERREPYILEAATVPTCAGIASPGNPYPCCTVGQNTRLGNCTYYAWHAAKSFWGYSMPTWGGNGQSNAKYWFDKSKASGLPTSPTPGLYAIAVSSTMASPYGHVAWVMEIANNDLYVWEQQCGSTTSGVIKKWRSAASFNKGYVMSPISAPSPTISLATVGPIFKSTSTQAIQFRVTNVNPGKRAVVIFPNGGRATLKDAQLSSVSNGILTAYLTLNASGIWKIQVFNENGKFSGLASFTVN
ncbi:MAG: CHAP domain-containing protein [Pyrinomonadaceae bacterium]